jgi:ribose 5-phosphate isomerase B
MQIFIGADHRGFELKNILRDWLRKEGHEVVDLGAEEYDKDDDYPDFGIKVAQSVADNPGDSFGIVICGSGVGMAVVADKVKGVRAGMIHDPEIARASRRDDDINVLALGADFIDGDMAKDIVGAWLDTDFSGEERHVRRIGKISGYENS